nr:MAG TPA: hypothetical protein [Bacteriophage sp.]
MFQRSISMCNLKFASLYSASFLFSYYKDNQI